MSDFKSEMHQIRFPLGLRPNPAGGAYSAPSDLLAGFNGAHFNNGRERGRKGEGNGFARPMSNRYLRARLTQMLRLLGR